MQNCRPSFLRNVIIVSAGKECIMLQLEIVYCIYKRTGETAFSLMKIVFVVKLQLKLKIMENRFYGYKQTVPPILQNRIPHEWYLSVCGDRLAFGSTTCHRSHPHISNRHRPTNMLWLWVEDVIWIRCWFRLGSRTVAVYFIKRILYCTFTIQHD